MKKSAEQKRREVKKKCGAVLPEKPKNIASPTPIRTKAIKDNAEEATNPDAQADKEQHATKGRPQRKANRMTLVFAAIFSLLFAIALGIALKGGSLTHVFWSWIATVVFGLIGTAFYVQAYVIYPREAVQKLSESASKESPVIQHPLLAAEDVVLVQLGKGKTVGINVSFRNSGQSLARNVTTLAAVWSARVTDVNAPCSELPLRPTPLPFQSKGDVGVNAGITIPAYSSQFLSDDQVTGIKKGDYWLYVYAIAEYEGIGGKYSTEVYGRYDIKSSAFVKCDRHNNAN